MNQTSQQQVQAKRDSIEMLYSNSYGGLLVSFITSCALAFSFDTEQLQSLKYLWLTILLITLILRSADLIYWKLNFQSSQFNLHRSLIRFNTGVILTAILWCSYIFLVAGNAPIVELAATLIIISAMAGGAATILSGSKLAAVSYTAILLIPGSFYLLTLNDFSSNLFGGLGLVFAIVIISVAIKTADFTQNAIQLKNYNRLLVEEMESEVEKRTQQIYTLSNLDPLTQLYNRSAFTKALASLLSQAKKSATQTAILFIDLDGFKQVNDALGHEVGDRVLILVTKRLMSFRGDGHLGRWGGDEFVLAIPDCDENQAIDFGTQVIKAIGQAIQIESLKLNVGASVGIAFAPTHSVVEQKLIQFADIAMYKQKKSDETLPRVFSNDLYDELRQQEVLREGLRGAIKRDEFFVVYQPILDFQSASIASCEALLRWSFKGQFISPVVFIEICEQTGLIVEIGKWVLKRACEDAMQWQDDDKPSKALVSVNVSVVQLLEESFIDYVDQTLLETGLPAERLILEITESTLVENKSYIKRLLEKIKSRNIKVSIDDFGTGYSSMSQLQSLPFDIIKIDRSFVNSIQQKGEAIIKATLFIAQELKCNTVAEGIETQQQSDQLKSLGATYLQGYLFAKPMKQIEVIAFMANYSREQKNQTKLI